MCNILTLILAKALICVFIHFIYFVFLLFLFFIFQLLYLYIS